MSLQRIDYTDPTPVPSNNWIDLVAPAANLANQIAATDFVPKEFRNKPDAITACVLYGAELGLGPMVSLSKIAVIQGKPAPYAELGRALALAAGHEVWVEESTNTRVTVRGRRKGSQHVQVVTWTMDDVKKAGISNHNYSKYPRQMLLARASAELVRSMCPDVLGGIAIFAEEAEGMDDGPVHLGAITATPADEPKKATNTRKRRDPASTANETPAEPVDPAKPSDAQRGMALATFAEVGITDRADRINALSALVEHPVTSWNDLTRDEASRVIDGLERVKSGDLAFVTADDGTWSTTVSGPQLFDDQP